ncbi:MAG: hypothetical protein K8S23_03010 [Candidatus Cloacimonetes bacterium]|nr:hypothetical protein [Candidatus Cloacimonadota bacterium]
MKNKLLLVFVIFIIFISLIAQDAETELMELGNRKRAYKNEVYEKTLKFVKENPDAESNAKLYFNLAELSTELFANDLDVTIGYYNKVLEVDPDFADKDIVLYNLGYFSFRKAMDIRDNARINNPKDIMDWPPELRFSEEKLSLPINAYKEVMGNYPLSEYYVESIYRLGTIYFEIAIDSKKPQEIYPEALNYFDIVAKSTDHDLQDYGIFQRGWTYFSNGNFDLAIADFSSLLGKITTDSLDTKKSYFEADAIENIAFSLIETDGTEFNQESKAAEKAKVLFANFISEEYAKKVIQEAINLKLKYSAPMQAIDLYNSYIDLFPLSKNCPTIVDSIMNIYMRYPDRTRNATDAKDMILDQKERIVNIYTYDSDWFQENRDKDIANEILAIRDAYDHIEPYYSNRFTRKPSEENYLTYKNFVENFIRFKDFQDDSSLDNVQGMRKNLIEMGLYIASTKSDPSLYFSVTQSIDDFNENYPGNDDVNNLREDKFYANEQIFSLLKDAVIDTVYTDTLWNITLTKDSLDTLYIDATKDFEELLLLEDYQVKNKNSELIRIIYQRADIYYGREEYDLAKQEFLKLLTYDIEDDLNTIVYSNLAEISELDGDYSSTENYYREAIKYASSEEKNNFKNNILATIQSSAENLDNSEDFQAAAEEYLRLSKELEKTDIEQSVAYKIKAIGVYQKIGDYQKAIDLYIEIASQKTDKIEVLASYKGAWTISDSAFTDYAKSIEIRKGFINRFPKSNEAYELRLNIISFYEGEKLNNKEVAAEMYLQLYEDAATMDIGEDSRDGLYIKAIILYQELGMNEKYIEHVSNFQSIYPKHNLTENLLKNVAIIYNTDNNIEAMLAFEKKYPNHPSSNNLLFTVANIYNENNESDKFEEIALYIYKKDPSIDLLTDIALKKMMSSYDELNQLFLDKNYVEMHTKIKEFKVMNKKYTDDGVSLDLTSIYDRFTYYDNYISYYKKFDKKIQFVYDNVLDRTPFQLIKVNNRTDWNKHLIKGAKRIDNLMNICDKIQESMLQIVSEGNSFNLPVEDRTKAIYLIAKSYDYSAEVVDTQIKKFIKVSAVLNHPTISPIQKKQYTDAVSQTGKGLSFNFKKKAANIYINLLKKFHDDKDYSDEWTDLALERVTGWGLKKELEYVSIYSNDSWLINNTEISDFGIQQNIKSLWNKPNILPLETVFDESKIIQLSDGYRNYIPIIYNADIKPQLIEIDYISNVLIDFTINNQIIDKVSSIVDTIDIKGTDFIHYNLKVNGISGTNEIVFSIKSIESIEPRYFASKITGHFDKEKLHYFRTTEEHQLLSDFSWLSKKGKIDATITKADDTWETVDKAKFIVYKATMYGLEESDALGIWYPQIDTTKVETVYFIKNINIPAKIHSCKIKYLGQKTTTLWINHEKLVNESEIILDNKLLKAQANELIVTNLQQGKNTILVKVVGDVLFKGFIFEMNFVTDKYPADYGKIMLEENTEPAVSQDESVVEDMITSENLDEAVDNADFVEVIDENSDSQVGELEKSDVIDNIENTVNESTKALDETIINESEIISSKVDDVVTEVATELIEPEIIKEDEVVTEVDTELIEPEMLEEVIIESNLQEHYLVSDYSWFSTAGEVNSNIIDTNDNWSLVTRVKLPYSDEILSKFSEHKALSITHLFDELKNEEVRTYYFKKIHVNSKFVKGKINLIGNRSMKVWLNTDKILDAKEIQESIEINNINLVNGDNNILVELIGIDNESGFVFELMYQTAD